MLWCYIETPDAISERAGAPRCRMRDHYLWPFYCEINGWDDSVADTLTFETGSAPLRKGVDLMWPRGHVYEFGDDIVYYAQSGLVSVEGTLYAVFYEREHVLGSYAWLAGGGGDVVVVPDAGLRYKKIRRGECNDILRITGLHFHRSTGEAVRMISESGEIIIASGQSDCMRIRPLVPWHTLDFYNGGAVGPVLDLMLVRLQRWIRKKCAKLWSAREYDFWNQFRDVGHFALLSDDLFRLIVRLAVRKIGPPLHRVVVCLSLEL
jgi:hypothetical protein